MSESNTVIFNRGNNHENGSGGESSSDANDIWDDTLLIEAYDRAVKIAKETCGEKQSVAAGKKGKKSNAKGIYNEKWKVGDRCRCQYSEDLNYYEADIIDVISSTGMCTVKYVGYENEEKVELKNLKSSDGEEARLQQIRDAANDIENNLQENYEEGITSKNNQWCTSKNSGLKKKIKQPSFEKKSHSRERPGFTRVAHSPINFSSAQALNSIMPPPPPPPHMFRNLCEDENESEAMSAMLISWYMSGYHTGYYQGLKMAKKQ